MFTRQFSKRCPKCGHELIYNYQGCFGYKAAVRQNWSHYRIINNEVYFTPSERNGEVGLSVPLVVRLCTSHIYEDSNFTRKLVSFVPSEIIKRIRYKKFDQSLYGVLVVDCTNTDCDIKRYEFSGDKYLISGIRNKIRKAVGEGNIKW